MFYEIKLKIKDYAMLNVYTNSKIIKDKFLDTKTSLKKTVPVTEVLCSTVNYDEIIHFDSIIIDDKKYKNMYYDKEYNVAILSINENEVRFTDLVYISLAMFSKILSRTQKYLLHSSSLLHPSNKSFLLVGEANSGKTSLGYELMSEHNCKLISNDHSVIGIEDGQPKILAGTKEIQMRLGAIELYFPKLFQKININCEDKWNKRIIVNDFINSDLILDSNNDKVVLTDVFGINTSNLGNSFIKQKDKIDEFLFLYESMSRIIKGTYNYIIGFDYPMPSMENEKILYELSDLCKMMIEQCNVSEAKGSIRGLAKELVRKYEK